MQMSRDKDHTGINLLKWKGHVTLTVKDAYIGNELQLQNHSLTFIDQNISLLQLAAFYHVHPWFKRLLLPWTS